jgi:hypothetical protein
MRFWNQPGNILFMNMVDRNRAGKAHMSPEFLIPETTVREAGAGPEISLDEQQGGALIVTLGIMRIIEQESLDLSIWGSADGSDWGVKPLASFPQKFYCGTYQMTIELSQHPEVKYLRAKWQVNRWGKGDSKPLFGLYLFVQATERQMAPLSA